MDNPSEEIASCERVTRYAPVKSTADELRRPSCHCEIKTKLTWWPTPSED